MKTLSFTLLVLLATAGNVLADDCDFILTSTTDFATGSTTSLNPDSKAATINVEAVGSDAVLRMGIDGLIYVVNRAGGDNIQVLDPCDGFDTVRQFSTGNGSNPHDIVFTTTDKAYVSRYDMTSVLIVNPQTGASLGSINLASFADADGLPEMDQMFMTGDFLCVLLQRLDRNNFYAPVGTSYMVVINTNFDTVVDMDPNVGGTQAVTLLYSNPYSEVNFATLQGLPVAYFSDVAFFGVQDGGVQRVTLASPAAQGTILTEAAAGGDILDVEIISDTIGYAIVATPSFTTILIQFNPTLGTKTGATLYAPGGYDLNDCEPHDLGGVLLLADRKPTNPGVRCFDLATGVQTTVNPVATGLPPFDLLVNVGVPTAAHAAPLLTRLAPNYPNPFNPQTTVPFALGHAGHVTLRIYDVAGHAVATLVDETRAAGTHAVTWSGVDDRGRAAPSGVYFARLDANGFVQTHKLVLMK
jgi:hypothetical protein